MTTKHHHPFDRARFEATLANKISIEGIGVHGGHVERLEISPLCEKSGIQFHQPSWQEPILAHVNNISGTQNATSLGPSGNSIQTIEHLLAAFWALGIDNALVELKNNTGEIPILQGNAASFYAPLKQAGIRLQGAYKRYWVLQKPHEFTTDWGYLKATPHDGFAMNLSLRLSPKAQQGFSDQEEWEYSHSLFESNIQHARTFGLLSEHKAALALGLAKGASEDNTLALDHPQALALAQSPYEPLRHKFMDAMGDLALGNGYLCASFQGEQIGHTINHHWLKSLVADASKTTLAKADDFPKESSIWRWFGD